MSREKPGGAKRRVVIVFGGRSAEHEVSVASARSVAITQLSSAAV